MATISKKTDREQKKIKKETPPEVTVSIVRTKLKIILRDLNGYMVAIDMIDISKVHRVSYNVITGELILIFPETSGRIGMMDVEVVNQETGEGTGEIKKELAGQITSYKTALKGKTDITKFLKIWLGVDVITEDLFEGFKHHDLATEIIAKATNLKIKQMDKAKLGLLGPDGKQVITPAK